MSWWVTGTLTLIEAPTRLDDTSLSTLGSVSEKSYKETMDEDHEMLSRKVCDKVKAQLHE